MKKFIDKFDGLLAALAIVVVSAVANSTCIVIMHQEPLPEEAKKLRKF